MEMRQLPLTEGTMLFNRYRIRTLLGQGGMSRVYLAEDTRLNIRVAVKENLQADPQARAQFQREAQILATLSHPNLPRVIDHFDDPATSRQYLVMDYIEGEDLDAMVKRVGPLPETYALTWIQQIFQALEYLHSQTPPIIHRDIKPANIKITPQGKAVLVDFGIAKAYDPRAGTVTGARAVTPGYAPPEQYGMHTDQRSDVYALGATLYKLITGQNPPEAILRMSNVAALTPLRQLRPDLSPNVENAIVRALEVDTQRRWQSVADFRSALLAVPATGPMLGQPAVAPTVSQPGVPPVRGAPVIPPTVGQPAAPPARGATVVAPMAGKAAVPPTLGAEPSPWMPAVPPAPKPAARPSSSRLWIAVAGIGMLALCVVVVVVAASLLPGHPLGFTLFPTPQVTTIVIVPQPTAPESVGGGSATPTLTPRVVIVTATPTEVEMVAASPTLPPPPTETPVPPSATAVVVATNTEPPPPPTATRAAAPPATNTPGFKYPAPVLSSPQDKSGYLCFRQLVLVWSGPSLGPNEWFVVETTKADHPNDWGGMTDWLQDTQVVLSPEKGGGGCAAPWWGGLGVYLWRVRIVAGDKNTHTVTAELSPPSTVFTINYGR